MVGKEINVYCHRLTDVERNVRLEGTSRRVRPMCRQPAHNGAQHSHHGPDATRNMMARYFMAAGPAILGTSTRASWVAPTVVLVWFSGHGPWPLFTGSDSQQSMTASGADLSRFKGRVGRPATSRFVEGRTVRLNLSAWDVRVLCKGPWSTWLQSTSRLVA